MVPLYLPHVAEDEMKTSPLFFGGINLYLQKKYPWFQRSPEWLRNLLDHPALLRFVSRFSGMTTAEDLGEMTLDSLEMKGPHLEFEKLLNWMAEQVKPDIVILSNCLLMGFAKPIKERLLCKVAVTLHGEDSFLDGLQEPYASKSWQALKEKCCDVDFFMPVSKTYGAIMQERMGISNEALKVVYNGIDLNDLPVRNEESQPLSLGFLANIIAGKGLMTLAEAFVELKNKPENKELKLIILGSVTPFTKDYLDSVIEYLKKNQVYEWCQIQTNLSREEKYNALKQVSILSVPATYGESFGLYILEALALGIPVVQPDHGAFREILEELKGGLLCEPDDPKDLADKCQQLLNDTELRRKLGETGRENVFEHFSKEAMAKRVAQLIKDGHD
jgi:glycosyltransferase involved in cell wall biosynthesis